MDATIVSITENAVNLNITPTQPVLQVLSGYAIAFGGIINPMTTFGDMIYANSIPSPTRLPGNTTATKKFLTQTGNGTTSGNPGWSTILIGDLPDLSSTYAPVLPSQTGNALKFLTTDATTPSWANGFTWDSTNNRLIFGSGNTNTVGSSNFIIGLNCSIQDTGSWCIVMGEDNHINRPSGSYGVGDNGIFSGYQNYITTTSANTFVGTFESAIVGGFANVCLDGTQSTIIGGSNNLVNNRAAMVLGGEWGQASGYGALAHGKQDDAGHTLTPVPTQRVLASGTGSVNISTNNNSQTVGHGALADRSVILGGRNGNVPSDSTGSGILGGDGIKARATDPHQWYLPNLNITSTPLNDDTLIQVLVRDSSTGQIKYRNSSSIGSALPSVNTGDILYGSATNVWSKLPDVATGNALISGGVLTAPSWGKINLSTHVTGQLPDLYTIGGDRYKILSFDNKNNYTGAVSSNTYGSITFTTSTYSVWKPKIEFIIQVTGDGGGREVINAFIEVSTDNATWSTLSPSGSSYYTSDANAHTTISVVSIHIGAATSTLYYYRLNASNTSGGNAFYSQNYGVTITSIPI